MIPVDIATIAVCYGLACKIATEDDYFWYKTILDTIVEHLLQPKKGLRMIQPHIGEEEKVQFWELVPNASSKFSLEANNQRGAALRV